MIGWGTIAEGGAQSSVLQEVEVTVVDDQTCSQAMAAGGRWDNISSTGQIFTKINMLGILLRMNKFVPVVKRGRMRVRSFSFLLLVVSDTIGKL